MSSEPTRGPWHVAKGLAGREIRADDGPFIASVYDHTFTYGERNANARLIAAAPDLLAACKDAFIALPMAKHNESINAALKAAIAKAEGDSDVI